MSEEESIYAGYTNDNDNKCTTSEKRRPTDSSKVPDADEAPRPQLSAGSNDEDILREVCLNNGVNYKNIYCEGSSTTTLEMFFSGYPRLIGMHNFPNLSTLTVIGQSVCRMEGLTALTHLEELWIAECQLTVIGGLEKCTSLKKLYLYGNKLSMIENISHLTNITVLWLNNNRIRDIENLHTLTKLKVLNLAENLIGKIENALIFNTMLEELNLSGNPLWSLRDLTCLAKLNKLTSMSLKDPMYHPCPVSQLCNYSTHVIYHLPKLTTLDMLDITSKYLSDLAESTVNKKRMFYNMRVKTIQRNISYMLTKLEDLKKELLECPFSKLRVLNFVIKEMERDMDVYCEKNTLQNHGITEDKFRIKLDALKLKRNHWETKVTEIETYSMSSKTRIKDMTEVMVNRLLVELESGGNVRFEEGQSSDPWFSSCHDLVLSRFCAYDYRDLDVVGIKIHKIIRIHNRMLRTRFDKSIIAETESTKGEYYPGMKNTSYKKSLEYLFWVPDPELAGCQNECTRLPEEGFMDGETYMKLCGNGAVPLSNSISLADRRRIAHCIKISKDKNESGDCPFRYGQLVVAKTHLGKSVVTMDDRQICKASYPNMDSVFKPRKKCMAQEKKQEDNGCECSARQCEWYIFNNSLVLPEYIIEFEYITRLKARTPFRKLSDELMSNQPPKEIKTKPQQVENDMNSDEDIIKMEPEFKSRPRMVTLTNELICKVAKVDMLHKITTLNLHGNGLTKLKHLKALTNLKKLVVSYNELTKLDELSNMQLTSIDASFNKIYTLDGMKGLSALHELDVSWNMLVNTREELSILRKHLISLRVLDLSYNSWLKEQDLRLRVIGRMKNLQILNGKKLGEEESALALQYAIGSRISQMSLLNNSRTDTTVPRSLTLGNLAQIIITTSHQKPAKTNDSDNAWYSSVTTLFLDNNHITKLSSLDNLENLLWASFNNNDLTRIEGLDNCGKLLELSLRENCIANMNGLSKLTQLQRLDLSHNCLIALNMPVLSQLVSLTSLSLDNNQLTSLAGIQHCTALVELYIGNNLISSIREVFLLKSLPNLVILDLFGNSMASMVENYRLFVIYHLRSLKALDGTAIEANEGNIAKDTFGGRLTPDFVAEKLGHSSFLEVQVLDLPNCAICTVDLATETQFINLISVNLEHNNLQSLSGLIHLVNLRVLCLNHNHIECIVPKSKTVAGLQSGKKSGSNYLSKNVDYLVENCTPVLENLEVLHLGYNGIKDLVALQLNRLPSLKALFLQGNEITKVEGIDGLHDLRELVLDHNRIKQLSEYSFTNQWNIQELHIEENRLRDMTGLSCLGNLIRLYLGSNRIQELSEIDKLNTLHNLVEISLVNNAVTRRLMHRVVLVHRLPGLAIIDSIIVTEEERNKAVQVYADQTQVVNTQPGLTAMDTSLPVIGHYKPSVHVKVTTMQLTSTPMWGNGNVYDEETNQRGGGRNKRQTREPVRQTHGLPGGGSTNNTASMQQGQNSRMQYTYLSQMPYSSSQTAEYVESIARLNQQRANKR